MGTSLISHAAEISNLLKTVTKYTLTSVYGTASDTIFPIHVLDNVDFALCDIYSNYGFLQNVFLVPTNANDNTIQTIYYERLDASGGTTRVDFIFSKNYFKCNTPYVRMNLLIIQL